jgi:hypothetical protein
MKQLEYTSANERNQQRYMALEKEAAVGRKRLEHGEAADSRSHIRALERLSRQEANVKVIAREQRGLLAAARDANRESRGCSTTNTVACRAARLDAAEVLHITVTAVKYERQSLVSLA